MRKAGLGQNGIVCVQLALNSTGVNGTGPPTRGFFSTCSQPAVAQGFASMKSANCKSKTVYSIHSWDSVDAEGQLYALFEVILYKGPDHPQIWVSAVVLDPTPIPHLPQLSRDYYN